jgi:5-formyltetrahydrofolate cyclo-ligase
MPSSIDDTVRRLKQQIRTEALGRRAAQADAENYSRRIVKRLTSLSEYVSARTLMLYVGMRTEVRTQELFSTAWAEGKQIVVPFCESGNIELFPLLDMQELSPGMMGVLEPKPELRHRADRNVDLVEVDLVVAPGVAFDRNGGRLGYGKGYYDRFLHCLRSGATKLGICFECQLFPELPVTPHDVPMDAVVTEDAVYRTLTTY